MTQSSSLLRKVFYISIIGLLLFPLYLLGGPAFMRPGSDRPDGGGVLALMRQEEKLAQSSLGDIDPASETMKLATLGLKGVAVTILWHNANTYKDEENWEAFSATVNQIIKLQPNFITVWEYQAHNIAYNVSVEFDDYQARYDWVKKGLDFLIQGLSYNRQDYKILRNLGFFFGTKIGRSDERLQFRSMFRRDRDYHEFLSQYVPMDSNEVSTQYGVDNWLVARQWYLEAEEKVRDGVVDLTTSHLMFYKDSPGQLRNCAVDLEEEFRPEEPARRKWSEALEAWKEFGNRSLRTSWDTELRLNDKDVLRELMYRQQEELDQLAPGVRERLIQERRDALPPEQLAAFEKSPVEQSLEEVYLAMDAAKRLVVADELVVEEVPADKADEAYRLLRAIQDVRTQLIRIDNYRGQTNYLYWLKRCEAEQTQLNLEARALLYDARQLNDQAVLASSEKVDPLTNETVVTPGAKELYEASFEKWAEIFREYPQLIDSVTAQELLDAVNEYRLVLERLVEPFPDPFVLEFVFSRTGTTEFAEELDNMEAERRRRESSGETPSDTTESTDSDSPVTETDSGTENSDDTSSETDAAESDNTESGGTESGGTESGGTESGASDTQPMDSNVSAS